MKIINLHVSIAALSFLAACSGDVKVTPKKEENNKAAAKSAVRVIQQDDSQKIVEHVPHFPKSGRDLELQSIMTLEGQANLITSATFADFDANGVNDIAIADATRDEVVVYFGVRNDKEEIRYNPKTALTTGHRPAAVYSTDFNNDNRPDVITADQYGTLSVFVNNGDFNTGGFDKALQPWRTIGGTNPSSYGTGPTSLLIGKFDSDNNVDVLAGEPLNGRIVIMKGCGNGEFWGSTTGRFTIKTSAQNLDAQVPSEKFSYNISDAVSDPAPSARSATSVAMASGCLNSAGVNGDVAVASSDNSISIYRNAYQSGRIFAEKAETTFPVVGRPIGIAIADLDGDKKSEILSLSAKEGTIEIYSTDEKGQWINTQTISGLKANTSFEVLDIDGNNTNDIVVKSENSIAVYRNQRDASFAKPTFLDTHKKLNKIVAADVNGDGANDIVAVYHSAMDVIYSVAPEKKPEVTVDQNDATDIDVPADSIPAEQNQDPAQHDVDTSILPAAPTN